MKKKLLFLTLNTFSSTGGIEKVCRIAVKALSETAEETGFHTLLYSMYDEDAEVDSRYIDAGNFKGFAGHKVKFVTEAIKKGRHANVVILSHINLLLVGYLIKKISPKTKLLIIAHGIEVWEKLSTLKSKMIQSVDRFLAVSNFTANKLKTVQQICATKINVLNNCLDPFLKKVEQPKKEKLLKSNYGFSDDDFILLTLARLNFSEQYKGYDKVIKALGSLKNDFPRLKYLIVGKYDEDEKARIDNIIVEQDVKEKIVFAGFVADEDLAAHFNLSDVYIMPSTGEGFGVVFIEALFYGKPVISGNIDGSVDALNNGQFGMSINPNSKEEIKEAIKKTYADRRSFIPSHDLVIDKFGFNTYKSNLVKSMR